MKKGKRTACAVAVVIFALIIMSLIWGNSIPELNTYIIASETLPAAFDGFRIAHISDFHNASVGKNNEKLLDMLRQSQPDIIAITGDFIDSRNTDMEISLRFAERALEIAPCYYVSGNHEARIGEYPVFRQKLLEQGIMVLDESAMELIRGEDKITIIGVNDPAFFVKYLSGDTAAVMSDQLQRLINPDDYTVLLSHRPELFEVYGENNADLVLSGHAHGGQFRIPFIGGLFAPNQGFFPAYDAGLFSENGTNMIVSRGIGNSIIPLRINNRPELILIELAHIAQ